ncbi:MAG: type III-B CRISPR module RAMP protein Cmr6, partial [Oscillospiraceae bacterium]|nr:type III-B CRISPR module RAMP protein Cmr6 [Oscillospiraceae bacterium]
DTELAVSADGRRCAESIALLESDIFDRELGGDVFFDAFPDITKDTPQPLAMDNLAPAERTQAPNVITFLRVRPDVSFRFCFKLTDSHIEAEDGQTYTFLARDKQALFKRLICELGIGAKTNVGYGNMKTAEENGR